jgi:cell wall-associated NlpC family hydrolase
MVQIRMSLDTLPHRPHASVAQEASRREAACLAVAALRPRDAAEGMLATRWVAAHHLLMDGCRTAMQPGLPLDLQLRVVGRVLGLSRLQEGAMRELQWRQERPAARPVVMAMVPEAQPLPAYQAPVKPGAQAFAAQAFAEQALAQLEVAERAMTEREAALREAKQQALAEVAAAEQALAAREVTQREAAEAPPEHAPAEQAPARREAVRDDVPVAVVAAAVAPAPGIGLKAGFAAAGAGRPASAGSAVRTPSGLDDAMQARILADIAARAATSTSALAI